MDEKKGRQVLSVTITEEQNRIAGKYPLMSPSDILQEALNELIESGKPIPEDYFDAAKGRRKEGDKVGIKVSLTPEQKRFVDVNRKFGFNASLLLRAKFEDRRNAIMPHMWSEDVEKKEEEWKEKRKEKELQEQAQRRKGR